MFHSFADRRKKPNIQVAPKHHSVVGGSIINGTNIDIKQIQRIQVYRFQALI